MLSQNTRADWRASNPSRWLKIFSFAILALVISSSAALAQTADTQSSGDAAAPAGGRQMPTVDDQLQKLTKALTLTDDQQTKIKPILESQRTQMEAIRNDTSGNRRENFAKMRDVHEKSVTQVKTVLNDDQKKKYDELQEQMKQEGRDRMRQH
jgi:Spy/CpxP family protein refolding chaperone